MVILASFHMNGFNSLGVDTRRRTHTDYSDKSNFKKPGHVLLCPVFPLTQAVNNVSPSEIAMEPLMQLLTEVVAINAWLIQRFVVVKCEVKQHQVSNFLAYR